VEVAAELFEQRRFVVIGFDGFDEDVVGGVVTERVRVGDELDNRVELIAVERLELDAPVRGVDNEFLGRVRHGVWRVRQRHPEVPVVAVIDLVDIKREVLRADVRRARVDAFRRDFQAARRPNRRGRRVRRLDERLGGD